MRSSKKCMTAYKCCLQSPKIRKDTKGKEENILQLVKAMKEADGKKNMTSQPAILLLTSTLTLSPLRETARKNLS